MGWLDSFWRRDDPLNDLDLDPSLRKYLEDQAPKSYSTGSEQAAAEASKAKSTQDSNASPETYRGLFGLDKHNDPEAQQREKNRQTTPAPPDAVLTEKPERATPIVPSQSLFPDGRYAHLWANYKPPSELALAGKSDQEKLLDVVGGFKERQTEVSRAALENCADLQFALSECFRTGGWKSRMSMCRTENQALSRCMTMQGKLLRALGYLSLYERSEAESERIQMHADRLYGEMLEREKKMQEAKARGEKEPVFKPLLKGFEDDDTMATTGAAGDRVEGEIMATAAERAQKGERVSYDSLPEQMKLKLRNARLKGLDGDELVLAKLELEQDIAVKLDLVRKLNERYVEEKRERDERREKGEERFGDMVKRYFDFRKYPDMPEEGKQKDGASK